MYMPKLSRESKLRLVEIIEEMCGGETDSDEKTTITSLARDLREQPEMKYPLSNLKTFLRRTYREVRGHTFKTYLVEQRAEKKRGSVVPSGRGYHYSPKVSSIDQAL